MAEEHERICTVTFYGLSRADAHRLVRMAREHVGDYWTRRSRVEPVTTDWVVEARSRADSDDWGYMYGPWTEHNALMFVGHWNRFCGWKRYRLVPVMTEMGKVPDPGFVPTGGPDLYR